IVDSTPQSNPSTVRFIFKCRSHPGAGPAEFERSGGRESYKGSELIGYRAPMFDESSGRAVTGQRSSDRESDLSRRQGSSDRALFSADPDAKHVCIVANLSKERAHPPALTFPDTSLFIKVVRGLERKIDERLRSSTRRIAVN